MLVNEMIWPIDDYTWQFIALLIYRDKAIKILILSRENDKNAIKLKSFFLSYNNTIKAI